MTKYERYEIKPDYQDAFHEAKALYKAKHYKLAVEILAKYAKEEHTGALIYLGDCYYYGRGVQQDLGKATECYIKSGKFHFPVSSYGVLPEYYSQIDWCRKAAKNGHLIAQYKLVQQSEYSDINKHFSSGDLKEIGNLPAPDKSSLSNLKEAFIWYQKAAENGYAPAQYNLGWYYENGGLLKLTEDYSKAAEWYEKAAEQGFVQAQAEMARLYAEGKGVEQDKEKAAHIMEKLSRKEYKKIQFKLHNMEIGDTIIIGGRKNKKRATILLTCQCNSSINCGIATDKQCYMDAFGRRVLNSKKICFNNIRKKTLNDIFELKMLAEKSVSRNWKYFEKEKLKGENNEKQII